MSPRTCEGSLVGLVLEHILLPHKGNTPSPMLRALLGGRAVLHSHCISGAGGRPSGSLRVGLSVPHQADFAPRGPLAISGNILGCHNRGALISAALMPPPPNPPPRIIQHKRSTVLLSRNPDLSQSHSPERDTEWGRFPAQWVLFIVLTAQTSTWYSDPGWRL